jgi:hypothetical protein
LFYGPSFDAIQAFISYTGLRAPNAVDTVAAKYSYRITAFGSGRGQTKFAFVGLWYAIGEALFRCGFDLTCILE